MPPASRLAFGFSTLMFGAVSILWRESDLWRHARALGAPIGTTLAWMCAAFVCAGGLMLIGGRGALGAKLLAAGGLLLTLSCVTDIARAPATFASYIDFFELFAIVCGAAAVSAELTPNRRDGSQLSLFARVGFGCCNLSYAAAQVVFFAFTASLIPAWIPGASAWTVLTTVAFALAGVAMVIGRTQILALRLDAAMLALFALLVWAPRVGAKPSFENWSELMLTCVIAAAAWAIAHSELISEPSATGAPESLS